MILSQFQTIGQDLVARGLVSSHSGNMSIRLGERIIITRRGSMLGSLLEHDLVDTGVSKNDRSTPLASTELAVHRAIYRQTPALAVVHAHPPYAVALSLVEIKIVPNCIEDRATVGEVPILWRKSEMETEILADIVAQTLKECRIVMVRGHGSFAIGQLLEEAHNCTTALEESSQIICLSRSLQATPTNKTI